MKNMIKLLLRCSFKRLRDKMSEQKYAIAYFCKNLRVTSYWRPKIEGNMKRDLLNRAKLRRMGWSVLRVWEHDLKNPTGIIKKIQRALDRHTLHHPN